MSINVTNSRTNGIPSETTLLPCPFCGGEAKAYQHGDVGYVVQCRRCGIWNAGYSPKWSHITEDEFGGFIDEESAIAAWNTRAERTCKVVACYDTADVDSRGSNAEWYFAFTCGDELYWDEPEPPSCCPNCGAKVVER